MISIEQRNHRKGGLFLLTGLVFFCIPILASFNSFSLEESIRRAGELRVVTQQTPTNYFQTDGDPAGFEYELAKSYADYLGVQLKLIIAPNLQGMYESLRLQDAHIAAAGLTRTPEREALFAFGPTYLRSATHLIYRSDDGFTPPTSLQDLPPEQLRVVAHSSHAEQLHAFKESYGPLSWQESDDEDVLDLMDAVNRGDLTYTLIDSIALETNHTFYPRIRSAFTLTSDEPIAWMLKRRDNGGLEHSLAAFFQRPETQALLETLKSTYVRHNDRLNMVDNLTFQTHLRNRLPALQPWFEEAAQQTDTSWPLLAAIGYQESHWNPRAVSPTGVRGIMMLTRGTARQMGVKKRTDPKQSIFGGARYFRRSHTRIPARISEPDRTWLALAAYNVGFGHLEDARILTQRAGKDPDRWDDVAEHLPLLTQARWYKTVKNGYARGHEPVLYVTNIQRYLKQMKLESRRQAAQSEYVEIESELPTQMPIRMPSTL